MAEFKMSPLTNGLNVMNYSPIETRVFIFENSPIAPVRAQKIYDSMVVVPILYKLEDTSGTELNFTREVREWDVVLPFGNDSKTPRRTPTEAIYKGKKLKNGFM